MSLIKTPKDKKLLEKWNKILEKYDDCNAEKYDYDDLKLKQWDNFKFKKLTPDQYESRLQYFANAREIASTAKFKNKTHRKVWELHSEGYSLRDISTEFKGKISKDAAAKILREIKEYVKRQD